MANDEQRFDSVITQMVNRVDCDHLFVKPAGMYLTMVYRGPYDEGQAASYEIVRQYLNKHSFTPLAGMFVVEAVGPFFSDRKKERMYTAKLEDGLTAVEDSQFYELRRCY